MKKIFSINLTYYALCATLSFQIQAMQIVPAQTLPATPEKRPSDASSSSGYEGSSVSSWKSNLALNKKLLQACITGDLESAMVTLNHGANIDYQGQDQYCPLTYAIRNNHAELAGLLALRGATLTNEALNQLHIALTIRGEIDTCKQIYRRRPTMWIDLITYAIQNGGSSDVFEIMARMDWNPSELLLDTLNSSEYRAHRVTAECIKLLIEHGAKISIKDKTGAGLVHHAVRANNTPVIRELLHSGSPSDTPDNAGITPLNDAVRLGNTESVKLLLAYGADPSQRDPQENKLTDNANLAGHTEIAELLSDPSVFEFITQQCPKHSQELGINGPPIIIAAAAKRTDMVSKLVELGASPHVYDDRGRTPLWWAAVNRDIVSIDFLQESDADVVSPDHEGVTPAVAAALAGHGDIVEYLLWHGGDKPKSPIPVEKFPESSEGAGGNESETLEKELHQELCILLHHAIKRSNRNMVRRLLDMGAEVTIIDQNGWTLLHHAASSKKCRCVIELLLNRGLDINACTPDGLTPLMLAAQKGHALIMELLIDRGAFINETDAQGKTPLIHAAQAGQAEAIGILFANSADISTIDNDSYTARDHLANYLSMQAGLPPVIPPAKTPISPQPAPKSPAPMIYSPRKEHELKLNAQLLSAAGTNDIERMSSLIKDGADIRYADKFGETPLIRAAQNGHRDAIRLLLSCPQGKRIWVDTETPDCWTALMYAAAANHTEIVALLLAAGAQANVQNSEGRTPRMLIENGLKEQLDSARKCVESPDSPIKSELLRFQLIDAQKKNTLAELLKKHEQSEETLRQDLEHAITYGCPNYARYLLFRGADIDMLDDSGQSVAQRALRRSAAFARERSKNQIEVSCKSNFS